MSIQDPYRITLTDPSLFGNDAAEDERDEVFDSYFVDRAEIASFLDPANQLLVLRAYRGEGKSSILRQSKKKLSGDEYFALRTTGSSLCPELSSTDPAIWTRGWKKNIIALIASEVGSRIGMAWTDDSMSLVETAERNGFKSRSIVSAILDRLKFPRIPEKLHGAAPTDQSNLLQRWMRGTAPIWILVDDLDENFVNTPEARTKIASFFSACREVVNLVPEIRIRTGIRPNIWQIVRSEAESLSKVDQYLIDIRWETSQLRKLLARRIEGYLLRTHGPKALHRFANDTGETRDYKLLSLVFEPDMAWGFDRVRNKELRRTPDVVMSTLSRHRPRWMVQLAKLAGEKASAGRSAIITMTHISSMLAGFGKTRIDDLAAEYRSECPEVREIINAFTNGAEDFSTAELMKLIDARMTSHLNLSFSSSRMPPSSMRIAAFLYEIGFLTARADADDKSYVHYTFAEQPDLLHNRTNVDNGMRWEIHPIFRQALGLRTDGGSKSVTRKRK